MLWTVSPISRRERWALLAVWLILTVAAAAVARYGIDLSDEGYIVYPAEQVARGQIPYRDIDSLYTPLAWYVGALVFKLTGVNLIALRIGFGALCSGLLVGTYVLARQLVAPSLASVALVAFLLILPIPQVWAPYPAWYSQGALLISLIAFGNWLSTPRDRTLLLVGATCGVAFAAKPSLGLFGLVAFGLFVVVRAQALAPPSADTPAGSEPRSLMSVQCLAVMGVVAAFGLLIRSVATLGNMVLLLGTLAFAALSLVSPIASWDWRRTARWLAWRVALLAAGFLLVTLPWYVPLSIAAGWLLTFDSIFRNGASTAAAFYEPVFLPNRDAWEAIGAILGGFSAVGVLGWLGRRRAVSGRMVLVLVGLACVAVGGILVRQRRPADLLAYVAENLVNRLGRNASDETDLLPFVPWIALWGGTVALVWLRGRTDVFTLRLGMLVLFSACFIFQVYPEASYRHVQFSIAPFLVLVAVLMGLAWQWCQPVLRGSYWRIGAAACLLIFPAVMLPTSIRDRARVISLSTPLRSPYADVLVTPQQQAQVAMLQVHLAGLPADVPLFGYPVVAMANFLSGHPNPTRESYLPPGYLDQTRIAEVMSALDASATRFVVFDEDFLRHSRLGPDDQVLADYLANAYRPIDRAGSWVLLERVK